MMKELLWIQFRKSILNLSLSKNCLIVTAQTHDNMLYLLVLFRNHIKVAVIKTSTKLEDQ